MDEFEVMVSVLIALVVMICLFAVLGVAFSFWRLLG
jgi:hypothetical protein